MNDEIEEIQQQLEDELYCIDPDWIDNIRYLLYVIEGFKGIETKLKQAELRIKELVKEGGQDCRAHNLMVEQLSERIKELEEEIGRREKVFIEVVNKKEEYGKRLLQEDYMKYLERTLSGFKKAGDKVRL